MAKTKILYLSPVSFFKGGAERSLFDLMANPHIKPVLAVPEANAISAKAASLGIKWHVVEFGAIHHVHRPFTFRKGIGALKDLWRAAGELKTICTLEQISIVHSNGLKAHMINAIAKYRGSHKAVMHVRDIAYTRTEKLVWRIQCWMSDAMILVSHACWPDTTLPAKVRVIHNGTALVDHVSSAMREDGVIRLGFVGRIHPGKGLHLLLEWMVATREQGIKLHVSIRGTFSDDAPDYEAEIHDIIQTDQLQDSVDFAGFINDPITLYADLDCVVVPSHAPDPLPRSVMESMARGIPVLGYPAGGIGEMIENGKTGFLVNDATSFMQALEQLSNHDTLVALTNNARAKIAAEFTMDGLHADVAALYGEIS